MDIQRLKEYCLQFPGTTEEKGAHPRNILSYKVRGKQFAYFKTSEPEKWRFSIRVTPERFVELTDQPGIKPARYMQRFHWVTIVDVTSINESYLIELVRWSYNKSKSSLPKKWQREIDA